MNFVDGIGPVHNMWLNCLFLNHGLYVLVYVVVDVLALHGRRRGPGVICFPDLSFIVMEAKGVDPLRQPLVYVLVTSILDLAFLRCLLHVGVLLGQNLLVLYRLNLSVVVVLVDLAVDWLVDIFMLCWLDVFMLHGWVDRLCTISVSPMKQLCLCIVGHDTATWT